MDILPVLVPTRDEQGAPARTIVTIWDAAYALGRQPVHLHVSHVGYAYVRTRLFQHTKSVLKTSWVRGILLDDDMLLRNQQQLMDVIQLADKNNWNIVAPYMLKNGLTSLASASGKMLDFEEAVKLPHYTEVPMAGLGFYYGDIPLDYEFHEGAPYEGEDLNFFHETQLKPKLAPIEIKHLKVMAL